MPVAIRIQKKYIHVFQRKPDTRAKVFKTNQPNLDLIHSYIHSFTFFFFFDSINIHVPGSMLGYRNMRNITGSLPSRSPQPQFTDKYNWNRSYST